MKFSLFMREWLYGEKGYYTDYKEIGKKGDFYTSVSSSPFFGGAVANRFLESLKDGFLSEDCVILEIGAHKGYLLADIVQFIYTLEPKLLKTLRFATLEPRKSLREEQKRYFHESFGKNINFETYSDIAKLRLNNAFIVANEIFDAFECEVVKNSEMLYIKDFTTYFDKQNDYIKDIRKKYSISKGEIAVGYEEFAKNLSNGIDRFEFVTFDYGDKIPRNDFSLRVYHKHNVYPFFALTNFARDNKIPKNINLKTLYKVSDITYDVNFSHLKDAFLQSDIKTISYSTQAKALVDFGLIKLLEILKNNSDEKSYIRELNKVKYLIDPHFLGERFKCMIFRKS
ncbi:MAG: hypothetical protein GXO12_05005 [Epsilonproteobacteria bacterium]|nr:hypothetical protein [Campylobacterota bacterium]